MPTLLDKVLEAEAALDLPEMALQYSRVKLLAIMARDIDAEAYARIAPLVADLENQLEETVPSNVRKLTVSAYILIIKLALAGETADELMDVLVKLILASAHANLALTRASEV